MKWKYDKGWRREMAVVGDVVLFCNSWITKRGTVDYYASIAMTSNRGSSYLGGTLRECEFHRKTKTQAKKDAIELAQGMIDDYRMVMDKSEKALSNLAV